MDFFGIQSNTRARSRLLLALFVLALLILGGAIHVIITGVAVLLGAVPSMTEPSLPVVVSIGLVWAAILLGSGFRWLDVRAGGATLARRLGATPVSRRGSSKLRSPHDVTLLDVVAESAIAAGSPVPAVFVLRHEDSLNAFVLGGREGRHALVLTQGALEAFDRDELQAVVAHEFGHIVAGDTLLNMRLLIALGGLNALDEIGQMLRARADEGPVHPGMLLGTGLRAFAVPGVLLGNLLRAAVSREREFGADAQAVQFTRNPYALASALSLIDERDDDEPLHDPRCAELLHLCFAGGRLPWYRRLLASHPPLTDRVNAVDPHFAVKRRQLQRAAVAAVKQQGVGGMASLSLIEDTGRDLNATGLSDRMLLLLPDERSCLAVLFALFAPHEPIAQRGWLDAVAFSMDDGFGDTVKDLLRLMPAELADDPLRLIEHATATLAPSLREDNRRRVLLKLEALVRRSGQESLMQYATLQLIRRRLEVEFPRLDALANAASAEGRSVKTFDTMGNEFALLLSLIVEASGAPDDCLQRDYERVLGYYTSDPLPRRSASEPGIVDALEAAFQTLYVQPRPIRQAFVDHCVEIVQQDGRIERHERALLDLFAASLGCAERAQAPGPNAGVQRAA